MIEWMNDFKEDMRAASAARYLPALMVLAGGTALFLLFLAGKRDWHPWDLLILTLLFTVITLLYAAQGVRLIGRLHRTLRDVSEAKGKLEHEARERERAEERLTRINECLLSFGPDSAENMQRLVALCGELMGADCALYNRLQEDLLCSLAQWKAPPDFNPVDAPEGHLCYDVIRRAGRRPMVVRDLLHTRYAETDSNVRQYGLQTYVGIAVKCASETVGSLCVVYQRDFVPDRSDEELLRLLAAALGVEEERRRTEEQLRESEEKYRLLVQNQTDLIAKVVPDGTFRYVSPAFCETYGVSESDLIGKKFWLMRPESGEPPEEIADLFRPPYACTVEQRTRTEEGWRWLSWALTAVRDERGEVAEIVCVGRDITEQKRMHEALAESETRLRTIFESVQAGIMIVDVKTRSIVDVNPAAVQMIGLPREQIIGRICHDFVCPAERDRCPVIDLGCEVDNEDRVLLTGKGEECAIIKTVTPVTLRGREFLVESFVDITARKRAEEELRRLATIVEQAGEGIAVADFNGIIQFANRAWADMHGYEMAELIGMHLSAFHTEEQMKRDVIPFNEEVKRRGHFGGEVGHVKRDGTPFPTQMMVSLLRDGKGDPVGLIGFASDITERKRAEEELGKTNRELQWALARANDLAVEAEKANTAKSQFLANMSHEIRTPMNAIIGMVELALDTDLTAEQREYLVTVKESAEALLGLLNDILDLAKIEAGKLELEPIDFQLRDSLGDALKALAIRAHQKGLELAFEVDTNVPDMVKGDPMRLRQIITNLVGNAIKFTPRGQVVVRAAVEEAAGEEVRLHFSVSDTGIGIPKDQMDKILEPFEQADGSATRQYGGTGLGLTICRQLAKAMKGRLWVESEIGKGSTFHFTVTLGVSQRGPEPVRAEPVQMAGMPILVVDDNATNRRIMETLLGNWGMKPRAAAGGEEALEMMREAARSGRPFSAVLVDVHMPGMDGFTLVERMRADREAGDPAVIMLTSAGQRGDAARCRELGISAYLTKPAKQSELWDALMLVFGSADREGAAPQLITRHTLRENRRRLRILLAEDNPVNQKVAVRMLEKRGHKVIVAGNGAEAAAAVAEGGFDLVLMDVQMPEMDGYEATAAIREHERETGGHLPIIAMTAHAMEGDREKCLAAGMDGYVAKPVASRELFAVIEGLVSTTPDGEEKATMMPEDTALIDEEAALSRVEGDRELLAEIIRDFLDGLPESRAAVEDAVSRSDAAAAERAAHALKGSLGVLGAARAAEAAARLETLAREGDLEGLPKACEELNRELARVEPALSAMAAGRQAAGVEA